MAFVDAHLAFLFASLTLLPALAYLAIRAIDRRREQY